MAVQEGNQRFYNNLVKEFVEEPNCNIDRHLMIKIFAHAIRSQQDMNSCLTAILGRLNRSNPQVVTLALTLLDNCIYVLGQGFHEEVAAEDVVENIHEIYQRHKGTPVGDELLACLKRWSDHQFKFDPTLCAIPNLYNAIGHGQGYEIAETIVLSDSEVEDKSSHPEGAMGGAGFMNTVAPPVLQGSTRVASKSIPETSPDPEEKLFLAIIKHEFGRGNGRRFNKSGIKNFVTRTTLPKCIRGIIQRIYGTIVNDEESVNQSRRIQDMQTNKQAHKRHLVITLMKRYHYSQQLIQVYEEETRKLMYASAARGGPRSEIRVARDYLPEDFE